MCRVATTSSHDQTGSTVGFAQGTFWGAGVRRRRDASLATGSRAVAAAPPVVVGLTDPHRRGCPLAGLPIAHAQDDRIVQLSEFTLLGDEDVPAIGVAERPPVLDSRPHPASGTRMRACPAVAGDGSLSGQRERDGAHRRGRRAIRSQYNKFAYSIAFGFGVASDSHGLAKAGVDSTLALSDDGDHSRARTGVTDTSVDGGVVHSR